MKQALPLLFLPLLLPGSLTAQEQLPEKLQFSSSAGYSLFYTNTSALHSNDTLLAVPGNIAPGLGFRFSLGHRESWTYALSMDGGFNRKETPYSFYNPSTQAEVTTGVSSKFRFIRLSLDACRNVYTKGRFSIFPYTGLSYTFSRILTPMPVNASSPGILEQRDYRMKQAPGISAGVLFERVFGDGVERAASFSLRVGTNIPLTKTSWELNGKKIAGAPKFWVLPVGITLLVNLD